MKTLKLNSRVAAAALSLSILISAGLAAAAEAESGVKFNVRVNTPVVSAALHSGGRGSQIRVRIQPDRCAVAITVFDQKVARRLAQRTRYGERELLRLKRDGYTWAQIGRILDLPRGAVGSAVRTVSLEMGRHHDRRGGERECSCSDRQDRDRSDRNGHGSR